MYVNKCNKMMWSTTIPVSYFTLVFASTQWYQQLLWSEIWGSHVETLFCCGPVIAGKQFYMICGISSCCAEWRPCPTYMLSFHIVLFLINLLDVICILPIYSLTIPRKSEWFIWTVCTPLLGLWSHHRSKCTSFQCSSVLWFSLTHVSWEDLNRDPASL